MYNIITFGVNVRLPLPVVKGNEGYLNPVLVNVYVTSDSPKELRINDQPQYGKIKLRALFIYQFAFGILIRIII